MPAPTGPADATAPPDEEAPPTPGGGGGGAPGAVPSGGAGGVSLPDQGQGMLPPTTAPLGQNVPPQGNQALGRQLMTNITGAMHYARMFFPPHSDEEKVISQAFKTLSKHFAPDAGTMKGGTLPPVSQVARPQGGPPGAMPPLGGAGGMAGGPPMPPRGPAPMAPAGRPPGLGP